MVYNIVFVGVGGQGIITLAKLIASALTKSGVNALIAETHGLSQRGGSVIVHMRVGDANAPLVPLEGADLLVGLEMIEAVRYLSYLKRDGVKVVNDYIIRPAVPNVKVPDRKELIDKLESIGEKLYLLPATEKALEIGDALYTNIVILGFLTSLNLIPGLEYDFVIDVVKGLRNPDKNLKAFESGYRLYKELEAQL